MIISNSLQNKRKVCFFVSIINKMYACSYLSWISFCVVTIQLCDMIDKYNLYYNNLPHFCLIHHFHTLFNTKIE